jgi:hypothetical protein
MKLLIGLFLLNFVGADEAVIRIPFQSELWKKNKLQTPQQTV